MESHDRQQPSNGVMALAPPSAISKEDRIEAAARRLSTILAAAAAGPMSGCNNSSTITQSVTPTATTSNALAYSTTLSASKKTIDAKESRQPFPAKVYEMLQDADKKGFSHIVSWNPKGTGFMVHNKEKFTTDIVPRYFNLTKYKSFQRQLSLYGCNRVAVGEHKGLRYHKKLVRGHAELVREMKPIGYKSRNPARIMEHQQQRQLLQQHQQLQKLRGAETNITTTTTTTVVKTTTTSTTLVTDDPLNTTNQSNSASKEIPSAAVSSAIIDSSPPTNDVVMTAGDTNLSSTASVPNQYLSATSMLPVVSTNDLIRPEDQEAAFVAIDGRQQHIRMWERQNNRVHTITPETRIHSPSDIGVASTTCTDSVGGSVACAQVQVPSPKSELQQPGYNNKHQDSNNGKPPSQTQLEYVHFEGMDFHLMPKTAELTIDVKLKLLEEFNPESSLLQLASKYVTPGYTTEPIVTTIPATTSTLMPLALVKPTIDAVHPDRPSLLEPFTDLVGATALATSTASAIASLKSAAEAAVNNNERTNTTGTTATSSAPPSFESSHMDALDFHTAAVAKLSI